MAKQDNDFVDINSSSQVNKVYKKKNVKGRATRTVVLILSIIMLLTGTVFVAGYNLMDVINYEDIDEVQKPTNNTTDTENDNTVKSDSLLGNEYVLNILLFGQDAHGSGENDFGRSDTIILLSLDNLHKKIKLTSFQRDTYVTIPGYGDGKLNSAFSLGGVPLSIEMVEANFGIKVDKYACVDFNSFRKIVDVLGGIDMEVTIDEMEYINAQIDVNNQLGKTEFLEIDYTQETQIAHLDGYQALWYARNRGAENLGGNPAYSFNGDDWKRTERQRKLLETIMTSLKEEASLADIVEIVNAVGPLVTTNLKKSDISFLVQNSLTYLQYDMDEMSLPTQPNWKYGKTTDLQSVIVITDWDQVRYDLAEFVYEELVTGSTTATTTP
ncbi:MAG: LCP family protein [Ruminococcus sp.]|nr:LCP family protein [Ruminococcus sp.]